nr:6476_t:CDS:2 [Entrophospora candida]
MTQETEKLKPEGTKVNHGSFKGVKKQSYISISELAHQSKNNRNQNNITKIGKYIAIDCEAVGIGPTGKKSALARVSIVNFHGKVILDKYVMPRDCITDYRTEISGITRELLVDDVQKEVSDIIKGRIIVGHSLNNDLKLLSLHHPHNMRRDSSLHRPFLERYNGNTPSLKTLAKAELNIIIQEGEHSSVQDAQTSMRLFRKCNNF